jgi:DNA-binding NarL/FixJ family response regulator
MIRVLLADDQAVVRAGLRTILESQPDMQVIGEAGDGAEALALAAALGPDIVMMDIRMPVLDGIKATRRLTESPAGMRVLVLTTYGLDEYVYDALRAGAAGFLLKPTRPTGSSTPCGSSTLATRSSDRIPPAASSSASWPARRRTHRDPPHSTPSPNGNSR